MATGAAIGRLRAELNGQVITPEDERYEQARRVFYSAVFDRRPAAIVRPADAGEVARVVTLARDSGLELAVRSGGHSAAGHSTSEGGLVLDLARLRGLTFDLPGRTAWAGTGLTAGEYTTAAAEHGLVTGFGDTASVGIGGLTLGGGAGYLSRSHGLTIDNLLAAEVVTAEGALLRADAQEHPDLFWALRGGGGNFGVATRFQFQLRELAAVVGGMLMLPATPEVVSGLVAEALAAPEELSVIAMVMPAPPMPFIPAEHHGRMVVLALMCYAGPEEPGQRALAPFRALATPLADMVQPIPYPQMFPPDDPDYRPTAAARTLYADAVDRDLATTILQRLADSDASMRVVQLRSLGGAISRVPDDATAYGHRQRQIMVNVAAFYQRPEELPVRQAWVDELAGLIAPGGTGAYVNFLGDDGPARLTEAYPGPTLPRLREVKARYDPDNVFRLNVNIPPA